MNLMLTVDKSQQLNGVNRQAILTFWYGETSGKTQREAKRQETDVNGICLNGICLYISEKQREREMPAQNRWLGEGVVGCVCMCV